MHFSVQFTIVVLLEALNFAVFVFQEALNTPGEELRGELNVVHQFLNMGQQVVSKYDPVTRSFNELCYT
jgi:hypothetical protein